MSDDRDAYQVRQPPYQQRNEPSDRQRDGEEYRCSKSERPSAHGIAPARPLKSDHQQTEADRAEYPMDVADAWFRRDRTAKMDQREGYSQRDRSRQRDGGRGDYARTPRVRSRAMSSEA